jgi:adenosylhomocysteine nucleosidase
MITTPAVIVGLTAEARIARRLGWPVVAAGGTAPGARAAAQRLVEQGATALISFGLAGGLDPVLRPGTLIVPVAVHTGGRDILVDPQLARQLGGATPHRLLGAEAVATSTLDKRRLWETTGAVAIDLESGPVAEVAHAAGLPFAVQRAICDPADRDLPPAAQAALDRQGAIAVTRVLASLLAHPAQLPALLALAADATRARRALITRVSNLQHLSPGERSTRSGG